MSILKHFPTHKISQATTSEKIWSDIEVLQSFLKINKFQGGREGERMFRDKDLCQDIKNTSLQPNIHNNY